MDWKYSLCPREAYILVGKKMIQLCSDSGDIPVTQETTFKNCVKWGGWPYIHSESSEGRIPFRLEQSIFSSGRLHQRDWLVHWEREMTWWYRRPIVKLWVPGRKRWQNCSTQISDPWGGWAKYTLSAFSIMPGTEGWSWVLLAGMTFGYH